MEFAAVPGGDAAGFELPRPGGKEGEDDGADGDGDDDGGRDDSAVTLDVYLAPLQDAALNAEEALVAMVRLVDAIKSRRVTPVKAKIFEACRAAKDTLKGKADGVSWEEGGCVPKFLDLIKMFKPGAPAMGRLMNAHVAVARIAGGRLYPGRVTEYGEEGGEGDGAEGKDAAGGGAGAAGNAGKHKVEFADGDVQWYTMDLTEHVAFVGEVGRPIGEAMAAEDVGVILAEMGEAREGEDARKAAALACVALGCVAGGGDAESKEQRFAEAKGAEGVAAVKEAMERFGGDDEVQKYGRWALKMLAPAYEGEANGLYMAAVQNDVNKLNEIIAAGIGIRGTRYQVRGK